MIISRCKGCNAEIIYVTTTTGATMPLDAKAYTLFVLEPEGAQGSANPRAKPILVRASHFSTCSKADQFRRQR